MNIGGLRLPIQVAVGMLALVVVARAENATASGVSQKDFEAKLAYCKTCHGVYGQGYHGAFPIPRLAGQQPEYVENQLRAFIERRRENKFMFTVTHVLTPEMVKALATQFKDSTPNPSGPVQRSLRLPAGKSMMKEFPLPVYLHAPIATARTPKATARFRGWQASLMTTSCAS